MTVRKTPMRMCVACRQMKPKSELVRVVKTPEGNVIAAAGGKVNGRGAYVCNSAVCIENARKSGALSRALDTFVEDSVYDSLKIGCEELD